MTSQREKQPGAGARPWKYEFFPSGTCIVTRNDGGPHYYLYGGYGHDRSEEFRIDATRDLCAWLNGERQAPAWARTLKRESPTEVTGACRIKILATGPMRLPPDDNGRLAWREESRDDEARAALIEDLLIEANRP
jgi:hypothetical protein